MLITRKSIASCVERTIDIPCTQEEYNGWCNGTLPIQEALPNLTPAQREFILTGIIEEEWDETFNDETPGTEDKI